MKIKKIISGGQTGVDRAAFDFALENGIEIGGWVPKGRLAEDGVIDRYYTNLNETATPDYFERTILNVKDSEATVIISSGKLIGGSLLTRESAAKFQKPFFHAELKDSSFIRVVKETKQWLESTETGILNIAGPRESEDRGIYEKAKAFLTLLYE